MEMDKFDRDRLAALQNEIEHETSPERIAELYGEIGKTYLWHLLTFCCGDTVWFARYFREAWNSYIKLIERYPNNIPARNNLAGLILLKGVQPEDALLYLTKLGHPIIHCGLDDKDLIKPIVEETHLKLSRKNNEVLKKYMLKYISCLDVIEYYESERLALKGLTYYLCDKKNLASRYFNRAYADLRFSRLECYSITPLAILKYNARRIHGNEQRHIENIMLSYYNLSKTKSEIDWLIGYYYKNIFKNNRS